MHNTTINNLLGERRSNLAESTLVVELFVDALVHGEKDRPNQVCSDALREHAEGELGRQNRGLRGQKRSTAMEQGQVRRFLPVS